MKIRRNSHYGKSPIAYPLKCALLSRAFGDKLVAYFCAPDKGAFIFWRNIMQKTKNKVVCIVAAVLVALSMLLSACGGGEVKVKLLKSDEKLVVIEATGTGGSLEDALKELKADGKLDYEGSISEYGFYLVSINGYVPDALKMNFGRFILRLENMKV